MPKLIDLPPEFNERFAAWLRIEPRCRQDNFATGIQACTADPLWMLARQWQTGEFLGEDAGSPIKTALKYATQTVDRIRLGEQGHEQLPQNMPAETVVEQEQDAIDFRERVRIGQEFERRLRARWHEAGNGEDVDTLISDLRGQDTTGFPCDTDMPLYELDLATQRFVRFMRGRVVDGLAVLEGIDAGSQEVASVCNEVQHWYSTVIHCPSGKHSPAWQPEKLDYHFELTARARSANPTAEVSTRILAPDYRNGDLDWYSFSAGAEGAVGSWNPPDDPRFNPAVTTPTRIEIAGTSPRWWAFEDGNTAFGAMDVATPDLLKLPLMNFVLIYGDDWFSVPAPVPMGSLVRVDELKVWNVFGEITTIDPVRVVYPVDTNWPIQGDPAFRPGPILPEGSRFELFTLSSTSSQRPSLDVRVNIPIILQTFEGPAAPPGAATGGVSVSGQITPQISNVPRSTAAFGGIKKPQLAHSFLSSPRPVLFIPPAPGNRQESSPLDEVRFLRDEGANMIWGVEQTVPNGLGRPVSGFDAQLERNQRRGEELKRLLFRLNRVLEYGEPSDPDRQTLETAIRDLQDQIADLSPYARPTPGQSDVLKYKLATFVPENWIPFVTVPSGAEMAGFFTDVRFRRAKMLRNSDHSKMEGNPKITLAQFLDLHRMMDFDPSITPSEIITSLQAYLTSSAEQHPFSLDESIPSLSRLLALDEQALLLLDEETIPRAGLRVQLTRQRMRWTDGSTHVWLGRKVLIGRGEGSSGLRFDTIGGKQT